VIVLRSFFKLLTVFAVGGLAYGLLEVLVRGYTFISMGVIGGICMVIIHLLNDERRNRLGLFTVMLVSSAFILSAELLSGEILNRTLDLNIWSYKDQPLNIDGQICAVYAALWFGLSFIAVVVDEWVRMKIFHEPNLPIFIRKAKRTAV